LTCDGKSRNLVDDAHHPEGGNRDTQAILRSSTSC
jgi:hypothetical protein